VAGAIERIVETYRALRDEGERFIDTLRRVGLEPFRERVYAVHPEAA
jgi:sulfite reductase (NADPH) hemoprotein beta-component